jgi:hypothetical protein
MVVREKARLEGMERAMRKLRAGEQDLNLASAGISAA